MFRLKAAFAAVLYKYYLYRALAKAYLNLRFRVPHLALFSQTLMLMRQERAPAYLLANK